jgi:hypothetical protein
MWMVCCSKLYMGGYSKIHSVAPRGTVYNRESNCGQFSHVRLSVGCESKYVSSVQGACNRVCASAGERDGHHADR